MVAKKFHTRQWETRNRVLQYWG